jgi:hypothetical protein
MGVTLTATEMWASDGSRTPVAMLVREGHGALDLATALRELAVRNRGGRLAVALAPPLTEVRNIELPPLDESERNRLLARNASRYFVAARGPQVVGTLSPPRRARGTPVPVVAAAASRALIHAIHTAAGDTGWTVDAVVPVEAAWGAAAVAIWPRLSRGTAHLLVHHDDRTDLLQLDDGRLSGVRRFRGAAADSELIASAIAERPPASGSTRIAAIGRPGPSAELARALGTASTAVLLPPPEWAELASEPDLLAARFAGQALGPRLESDDMRTVRKSEANRAATIVASAAAALLILAAGINWWGARRELHRIQEERARLKPQIAETLVGRTTIETAYQQLGALAEAAHRTPRWSAVIAALSAHLSDDAYLAAFRGHGDSVFVDGLADHASQVFDDLARTPGLRGVIATAPVRRETQDDGEALEHFTLGAALAGSEPPHSAAPGTRSAPGRPAP